MYVSKYYTCEEIDQRLLQGYYDDSLASSFVLGLVCATFTSKSLPLSSVFPTSKAFKSCDFKNSIACANKGFSEAYFSMFSSLC